jgi:mono/diheme cytochrome c family protein
MKHALVAGAGLVWVSAAVLVAQSGTTSNTPRPQSAPTPTKSAAATAAAPATTTTPAPSADEAPKYQAWVKQYCIGCHNSRSASPANNPVNLETASLTDPLPHAATWERVLRKLAVRAMPPQGAKHPAEPEYAAFTTWLAGTLDRAWQGKATPGRYVVHRLNRAEYRNAIRDLLALDVDVSSLLPNDGGDFGFDNIATALTTSPLLLDGYVTAAQRISTLAVGDAKASATTTEYSINRDFSQNAYIEGLPLGTRGGKQVRHVFPADGEYKLFGRLVRGIEEGYAGVESNEFPYTFVITLDGDEVYSAEIGGLKDHEVQVKDMNEARAIVDARMTAKIKIAAGPHDIGFTFRDRPSRLQDVWQPSQRDSQEIHFIGGLPKLKTVGVEGPYNASGVSATPSRDRVFVCRPKTASEEPICATRILSNLAQRAFRRPASAQDIEAALGFYSRTRTDGGSFDEGIRAGVARILVSPSFLYRMERDATGVSAGAAHAVTDIELASRLSFFLWSSIPDEPLLTAAKSGRLREPAVLAAQVKRMLADSRSDALVGNFVGQWLQLRNLESKVRPDILQFPDFDDNIRDAFRRETEMLFAYILRENRSILDLMNADYTFVNERLARHYGIPGVYGTRFRQVKVTDPNRRGLLGHGSILSLTSVATRTSPVFRGKYVLTTFLNTPPPPPLPNVPALEDAGKGTANAPKTVREQLDLHRANAVCASCHRVIDPVGFALENFNPVGQWRESDVDGKPLDTAGVLADGSKVDGPVALRNVILSRPDAFAGTLTERVMTYALGRGMEPSDMPVIRGIVKKAAVNNYAFQAIIMGIVESAPFQMRTRLESAERPNRVADAR